MLLSGAVPNDVETTRTYRETMTMPILTKRMRSTVATVALAVVCASCGWQSLTESAARQPEPVEKLGTEHFVAPTTVVPAAPIAQAPTPGASTAETALLTTTVPQPAVADGHSPTSTQAPRLTGNMIAHESMRSEWSGQIRFGDQDQPVTMWLGEHQQLIRGELTYTATGETRVLGGRRLGNGFFVHAFDSSGHVSTTLSVGSLVNGRMTNISGSHELAPLSQANFELIAVFNAPAVFDQTVTAGTFRYSFAPFTNAPCCGPSGALTITNVTADSLTVAIDAVTSAPASNIATIPPVTLALDGNIARFEERNDWLDCAFDLVIYHDLVFVDSVDGRVACGFGQNASVQGIYIG